ncbi:sensor histidine kinase [Acutalibacter caecimuris]|uniref:sensor histidine kinase n=1 Tax=Acutalibacter caecimuris TaxID=3093657 RepID=UPI002AC9564F|nr:HAMP domain-containing sensor histidine kinase [Acutalibacter sp. M00118]
MIRSLQHRFVFTAMAAITALILLLLGAINGANLYLVNVRLEHTLQMLGDTGGDVGRLPPPQAPNTPGKGFGLPEMHRNDYDTFMGSNYFVVRFDSAGKVVFVDVSRTSQVSREQALALAEEVTSQDKDTGDRGQFRYLVKKVPPLGTSVLFLDTTSEGLACLWVLLLSGGAGLVCWGLMLAVVVLLSQRAIRPIAENIERQKQFVTNAGHELKNPLAIIQSNTEAMELYTGPNKWSRNIRAQTGRLDGLVKELLLLARMDEGAATAQPEVFSLDALLEETLAGFLQPLETSGLQLAREVSRDIRIRADRGQIRQLISILLDNGIRHGDRGGELVVSLARKESRANLQVKNTCASPPPVPPDKLFERFYRGDSARSQKSGGYGIGLAVAKSIAQANGAKISACYLEGYIAFSVRFRLQ